jgi:hypothetical protein
MNKPRSIAMAGGRPTTYKPENAEIASQACMLGATNDTLAKRFEVCRRTIDNWIATIPEFSDAVQQGREVADAAVVSALFARATGMEQKMTKAFCHRGQPVTANYTVQLPPDVRACIFWLRNRRPGEWRENRPLVAEEDGDWVSELDAASERARLAARAERPRADPAQSAAEGPVRREADAPALGEAERAVRSAAERLHVHS